MSRTIPLFCPSSMKTRGTSQNFEIDYQKPIILDEKKNYCIYLLNASCWYVWNNISSKLGNNIINFSKHDNMIPPNIVNITYGRDVGYRIEQESFDESITDISATKIRKELGLK